MLSNRPVATIDFSLIEHNLAVIHAYVNRKFFAVVKGNAYGHGLLEMVRFLLQKKEMISGLAVGRMDEALLISTLSGAKRTLVMDGCVNSEYLNQVFEHNLECAINDINELQLFLSHANKHKSRLWIQIDAGLNHFGFKPNELAQLFDILYAHKCDLRLINLFFHLPVASNPNHYKTIQQIQMIDEIARLYQVRCSYAASATVLSRKKAWYDSARVGSALYGINPLHQQSENYDQINSQLKTAMSLCAPVLSVRNVRCGENVGYGENWIAQHDMCIAIVGIGYGDGYPRIGAEGAPVLLNGKKTHIIGKISMDKLTILLPDSVTNFNIGDIVTLWGPDLSINVVAKHFNTSAAVLFTGLNSRVNYSYR